MTVVQLLPSLESGGVERGTIEVSRALCEAGHRSIVISAGGRLVQALETMGAEHVQWDIGKKSLLSLRYVFRLRRFLQNNPVDILHARSRLPAWLAYLAWKGMAVNKRPRFVTTVHGLYSVKKYSAIMTKGEAVIAVSHTVKKYILDNYPDVDESRIQVIHRGIDMDEFPYGYRPDAGWLQAWHEQYPPLRGQKLITLPGRLTRLKGHQDFIRLMTTLRDKGIDVYGLIVGGEDPRRQAYAREITGQVNAVGLQERVIFTGHREDMREIYAVSAIVLSLSSKPESFGRTSLEALSLGTPVIAYDHGGVGEILHDIYPQGCVPMRDLHRLAEKVMEVLENPAPVPAQHVYKLDKMLSATLKLYSDLTRRRSAVNAD
jgi:glycosyltransferase involved in cell wall biosynthesis